MPDSASRPSGPRTATDFDVVVVGAGLAGLYSIHRLRGMGLSVRVFEAGDGVGGTWFWNRYPGCRCDVESLEYSYSFDPELEQEWSWDERYGTQSQILEYTNHVAERFDLLRDIQFETRVTKAIFDEAGNFWTVTTDTRQTVTGRYCIMAAGNLSTPRKPDIPGIESFQGKTYHTGLWPKDGVDFAGKRVGVIGTGSSGVQMIPHIAAEAEHLTVFQRTANFILPARNGPMDKEREAEHKSTYRQRRADAYTTPFGIAGYPAPTQKALDATAEERQAQYAEKWAEGGSISFLFSYTDLLLDDAANDTAAEFVRDRIRDIVKDPETAENLCPNDHPIGTKRLILDTDFYPVFNQDNVDLVNVRKSPIAEITPTGLRTANGEEYELDAIAFATGFDAMTGAMKEIDIQGVGGQTITEKWDGGPLTYLGLMVSGFPNMFTITGPGSPGVKSQMILSIEFHTNWIMDTIAHMESKGHQRIDPTEAAEDKWVRHVADIGNMTLYPKANSWYMGANIPGKPRVFMPYVAGVHVYKKEVEEVVENGYEGFVFDEEEAVTAPQAQTS
jgi:cyclohexanone monooxygenase